jgi:regulator of sigma E protease
MTEVAKESTVSLIYLSSIIAINLGICNLLPVPALDGGRLVFQFIELIFRRPVNRKIEAYIHTAGIVILLFFMLLITFRDVVNLF